MFSLSSPLGSPAQSPYNQYPRTLSSPLGPRSANIRVRRHPTSTFSMSDKAQTPTPPPTPAKNMTTHESLRPTRFGTRVPRIDGVTEKRTAYLDKVKRRREGAMEKKREEVMLREEWVRERREWEGSVLAGAPEDVDQEGSEEELEAGPEETYEDEGMEMQMEREWEMESDEEMDGELLKLACEFDRKTQHDNNAGADDDPMDVSG